MYPTAAPAPRPGWEVVLGGVILGVREVLRERDEGGKELS